MNTDEAPMPNETPVPFSLEALDPQLLWVIVGVAAIVALALILIPLIIWRRLRASAPEPESPPIHLTIDVQSLPPSVSDAPPKLEVYGTPIRLAVIVLAPVGRDGVLPGPDEFFETIEQLVPGFSDAVQNDQPLIRGWPGQLSSQGFAQAFFNNVPLPGDRGKGTPWCSLVGKFSARGKLYLAGIVCRANTDNALSQYTIQHEGQWNDVLRSRKVEL